ncbi:unnamed protein product, partial [Protopolystoma xenopodis]
HTGTPSPRISSRNQLTPSVRRSVGRSHYLGGRKSPHAALLANPTSTIWRPAPTPSHIPTPPDAQRHKHSSTRHQVASNPVNTRHAYHQLGGRNKRRQSDIGVVGMLAAGGQHWHQRQCHQRRPTARAAATPETGNCTNMRKNAHFTARAPLLRCARFASSSSAAQAAPTHMDRRANMRTTDAFSPNPSTNRSSVCGEACRASSGPRRENLAFRAGLRFTRPGPARPADERVRECMKSQLSHWVESSGLPEPPAYRSPSPLDLRAPNRTPRFIVSRSVGRQPPAPPAPPAAPSASSRPASDLVMPAPPRSAASLGCPFACPPRRVSLRRASARITASPA